MVAELEELIRETVVQVIHRRGAHVCNQPTLGLATRVGALLVQHTRLSRRRCGAALVGCAKLPPDPAVVTMPQLRMSGFEPCLPDDFRLSAQLPILIPGNGE